MAESLLAAIQKESPKTLLLSNRGSFFCSGGNLAFYAGLKTKKEGLEYNKRIGEILDEIQALKIPKACFVNGPCLGGGIELISRFDYIVAASTSFFGLWQRRIGLSFGWGGAESIANRVGEQRLQRWLQEATTLSPYRALQWGLIDQVSLSTKGIELCESWLEKSLSLGEESFHKTKDIVINEKKAFQSLWHSAKHLEALEKVKKKQ